MTIFDQLNVEKLLTRTMRFHITRISQDNAESFNYEKSINVGNSNLIPG